MPLRSATREDYERRLLLAQQLLEQRLDESVSPAELAKAASFSLHHFHRIFRGQLGESVMQRVRRLRLERAARRLRLIELAFQAGYESHEAFTRAFSEHFGLSPSDYRGQPSARIATWEREHAAQPPLSVSVRHFDAVRVAFLRHRGGYAGIGETWQRLVLWARSLGLLSSDFAVLYGICPDDTEVTPEEHLRFDASVRIDDAFQPEPGVGVTWIPSGTYAVGMHTGSYARLSDTYLEVIGRWFPGSGYEPAPEPVIEHYLNDPACTPAHELRTEVRVRIAE